MGKGKPRGLLAARKLRNHRRDGKWADLHYKKRLLGTAFKSSPFGVCIIAQPSPSLSTRRRENWTAIRKERSEREAGVQMMGGYLPTSQDGERAYSHATNRMLTAISFKGFITRQGHRSGEGRC